MAAFLRHWYISVDVPGMPGRMDQDATPAKQPPRVTTALVIYKRLHAAIVSMALPPGTPLQDKILCAQFSVSRTPVREALIRLAEDGLVDIFPQSGTFVSRIKAAAVIEGLEIRQALEGLTVGRAAEHGTAEDLRRIDTLLDRQAALAAAGDIAAFHEADEVFHETIGAIARHHSVWDLVKQVKVQIDRTRRLSLPVPGRMTQVVAEHHTIRHAIAAGDPGLAQGAMRQHLRALLPDLALLRQDHPTYFV